LISNQSELVEEINIRDEYRIIGFQMWILDRLEIKTGMPK
jgi:hypothetical protein